MSLLEAMAVAALIFSYCRSYQCYHSNHAFHITTTAATTPFRCLRCHRRHFLPHHTIALTPAPNPYSPLPHNYLALDSDWTDSENSFDFNSSHNSRSLTLKSVIDSLPVVPIADSSSCSICMEEFEVGARASQLPCDHFFHKDCIVPWLNRSNTCPLCRHKLPKEEEPEKSPYSYTHWGLTAEELVAIEIAEYDLERSLVRIVGASVDDNSGWIVDPMHDSDGDTLMLVYCVKLMYLRKNCCAVFNPVAIGVICVGRISSWGEWRARAKLQWVSMARFQALKPRAKCSH